MTFGLSSEDLDSAQAISSSNLKEPGDQGSNSRKTNHQKAINLVTNPARVTSRNLDLKMASRSHKTQSAPIKNGRAGRHVQLEPL